MELARNRPSKLGLIIACPAARRMVARVPRRGSKYAAEGTAAHTLIDRCLNTGMSPVEHCGDKIDGFPVDNDMIRAAMRFILRVQEDRAGADAWGAETDVMMPGLDMPEPGRIDAWAWRASTATLCLRDYKHGVGVTVYLISRDADGRLEYLNAQLGAYGWGLVTMARQNGLTPRWLDMSIIQPRAQRDNAGGERRAVISVAELEHWLGTVAQPAITLSRDLAAPFRPGDHCKTMFCDARGACIAHAQWLLNRATGGKSLFQPTERIDHG